MRHEDIRSSSRFAGLIERYHEYPTLRRQNNGEHTWQVMRIYCEVFGAPADGAVWHYILHHDSGELGVGDLPFPVKKNNPALKEEIRRLENESFERQGIEFSPLPAEIFIRVKICDLLEMHEFGLEEVQRGNTFAVPIVNATMDALQEITAGDETLTDVVGQYLSNIRWLDRGEELT